MGRLFIAGILLLLSYGMAQAADGYQFEVFKDAKNEYRWRLKNPDGKVVASPGQGYASKKYCEESVEKFKTNTHSDKVKVEF